MLVTEAEAANIRCQEGYAASNGATANPLTDVVHVSVPMASSHLYSAGVSMATSAVPATAPLFCLGRRCMAWRWNNHPWEYSVSRSIPEGNGWEEYHCEGWNYNWRRPVISTGYCGKVGRP